MVLLLSSLAFAVDILVPGRHADPSSVRDARDGDRWLVLEPIPSGWRLRETRIGVVRTVPTSEFDATVAYYDVTVEPDPVAGPALLLVRGLRPGAVVTRGEAPPTLDAPAVYAAPNGDAVTIGVFGTTKPSPVGYATPSYSEMTIQVSPSAGAPFQVVLGPVAHHESPPTVRWVGDIDGDGALDLLTVTPGSGGGSEMILWLSTAAASGRAVGRAASVLTQGC